MCTQRERGRELELENLFDKDCSLGLVRETETEIYRYIYAKCKCQCHMAASCTCLLHTIISWLLNNSHTRACFLAKNVGEPSGR